MDKTLETISRKDLENFFLNSNIDINFLNFFIGIMLSLILAYIVKYTYVKAGRALNDKHHFSDTFIPLAIITTLVITVVKFSLALSLGLVATIIIVTFLLLRNFYQSTKKNNFQYSADANVLSMTILDDNKKNVTDTISSIKKEFKYLKLKSANFEKNKSNYVFWYEIDENRIDSFLKKAKDMSDENLNISIYSKSGAFE